MPVPHGCGRWRTGRLLAALLLAGLLLLPGTAAGAASHRDRGGDVRARGVTAKERRALDLVSVSARGHPSLGLIVTATFRGDFEAAVGRGHLRTAVAALVLRPRSGARRPAGVLTRGAGIVGISSRRTRSDEVGVVRDGRRLSFFVAGTGLADVRSIEVKAFARRPRAGRAHAADTLLESAEYFHRVATQEAADAVRLAAGPVMTNTCAGLRDLLSSAVRERAEVERHERILVMLRDEIRKADPGNRDLPAQLGSAIDELLGGTPPVVEVRRELAVAQRLVDAALARNRDARSRLLAFERSLREAIAAACGGAGQPGENRPPVIERFSAGASATCDTCTVYRVTASDPEGRPLTYSWSKSPPPGGDPAATNCGTFTPGDDIATWDHPNDGQAPCSHAADAHPGHITVVVTDDRGAQTAFTDPNGSTSFSFP